jgi:hypothetical protein
VTGTFGIAGKREAAVIGFKKQKKKLKEHQSAPLAGRVLREVQAISKRVEASI